MDVSFFALNSTLVPLGVRYVIFSKKIELRPIVRGGLLALLAFADAGLVLWHDCHPRSVPYFATLFALTALLLPEESARPVTEALGKRRLFLYLLSVATVSSLIFLHLPIGTFLTSPGEIGIHLDYLTTNNVRSGAAVFFVAALLYTFMIAPRAKAALTLTSLICAFLVLIYSFVLPFGYPMMSGVMFEQIPIPFLELCARTGADALLAVLVSILIVKLLLRYGSGAFSAGLVIVNLSLLATSGLSVSRDTDETEEPSEPGSGSLAEQPLAFAQAEPNVLIIFLDRFMGGYVEEILKRHPDLETRLSGFTWYPNTVAAGQNSIAGVHPIFGGYDYTPREMNARGKRLKDLSVEAYRLLPENFSKKGYQVNFVNPRGLGFTMAGDCRFLDMEGVNCTHIPAKVTQRVAKRFGMSMSTLAESNYADLLVLLGTMRATPYIVKGAVHEKGPWKPFMDHSAGTTLREWAELKALPEMSRTDARKPTLNIVWSILPHEPYFMGEDCMPRKTSLELTDEEVARRGDSSLFGFQHSVAARCSLLLVADYMDHLRAKGVYENTKIVVVSDHGIVGNAEDHSTRAVQGGTTENIFVVSRSVLLVKDEGASGKLKVSEEFMPNADVPRIVCQQIGGCVNPHLGNKSVDRHGREDPFHVTFVPWQFNKQNPNGFVITGELVLKSGNPYDAKNWKNVPKSNEPPRGTPNEPPGD
jgi:hypothetical protein